MRERIIVLSAADYFETFGRNGIGKGARRDLIKRQILDRFRNEIFSLATMRAKKPINQFPKDTEDEETTRIFENILKDESRKWISVCKMFAKYKETSGLIEPKDLFEMLTDENWGQEKSFKGMGV